MWLEEDSPLTVSFSPSMGPHNTYKCHYRSWIVAVVLHNWGLKGPPTYRFEFSQLEWQFSLSCGTERRHGLRHMALEMSVVVCLSGEGLPTRLALVRPFPTVCAEM